MSEIKAVLNRVAGWGEVFPAPAGMNRFRSNSWVQRCVDEGKAILDKGSLIYILEKDGYVSVIKATKTGKALFVTSVRRLSSKKAWHDQELRRLMGKGEEK